MDSPVTYAILRPDGTRTVVTELQLTKLKKLGLLREKDQITPLNQNSDQSAHVDTANAPFAKLESDLGAKAWIDRFLSKDVWGTLSLHPESSDKDAERTIEGLRNKIFALGQSGSLDQATHQNLQRQMDRVSSILRDPTSRYVAFKAHEQGKNADEHATLRHSLQAEFFEKQILNFVVTDEPIQILPWAQRLANIERNEPHAQAYLLLGRMFASTSLKEKKNSLKQIAKLYTGHGHEPPVALAFVNALIVLQQLKKARDVFTVVAKEMPDHAWVKKLEHILQALEASSAAQPKNNWVTLFGILTISGIASFAGWFAAEEEFLLARGALLAFAAILGGFIVRPKSPFKWMSSIPLRLRFWPLSFAIFGGALAGSLLVEESVINLGLSNAPIYFLLVAVLCDRLFFSCFLGSQIVQNSSNRIFAAALIAIAYMGYQLSFMNFFALLPEEFLLRFLIGFSGLAFPLAFLHVWSRSVIGPILYQLAFVISVSMTQSNLLQNWFAGLW